MRPAFVALFMFVGLQLSFCALMLYHDYAKVQAARQEASDAREALERMTPEEVDELIEQFEDPTTKAQLQLEASAKRAALREQERIDMTPVNVDCRPSWNNMSPAEQVRRINEVLGTPNMPEDTQP